MSSSTTISLSPLWKKAIVALVVVRRSLAANTCVRRRRQAVGSWLACPTAVFAAWGARCAVLLALHVAVDHWDALALASLLLQGDCEGSDVDKLGPQNCQNETRNFLLGFFCLHASSMNCCRRTQDAWDAVTKASARRLSSSSAPRSPLALPVQLVHAGDGASEAFQKHSL